VVHDMGVNYGNVKGRLGNYTANVNKLIFVNFLSEPYLKLDWRCWLYQ
jgi:hypothetical protein